jgi:hypothetical protein
MKRTSESPRRRGSLVKSLSLALGAAVAGIHADAARALEPTASWCVIQHDRHQPECYENLATCLMVALGHASSCTQRSSLAAPREDAANQRGPRVVPLARRRAHVSPGHHKLTVEERDELFREFQQWERSPHE